MIPLTPSFHPYDFQLWDIGNNTHLVLDYIKTVSEDNLCIAYWRLISETRYDPMLNTQKFEGEDFQMFAYYHHENGNILQYMRTPERQIDNKLMTEYKGHLPLLYNPFHQWKPIFYRLMDPDSEDSDEESDAGIELECDRNFGQHGYPHWN